MNITHLSLSWSVSKGRDTYGYNICRLDDNNTGKRYKCMGGGYDMIGTCFGDWLEDTHRAALALLEPDHRYCGGIATQGRNGHYGLTHYVHTDGTVTQVRLDGVCGIESMLRIAEAIGLDVQREFVQRGRNQGRTIGYYVAMKEGN